MSAPKMFTAAAGEIVNQMKTMREGIGATLDEQVVQASLSSLRTAYAPLWDGAPRWNLPPLCVLPARTHARTHARAHACTHARTRTHARTHAHVQPPLRAPSSISQCACVCVPCTV